MSRDAGCLCGKRKYCTLWESVPLAAQLFSEERAAVSANALAARLTTAKEGDLSMHSQQSPDWQPPPPQPPRKSWPARHKVWTTVLAVVGVLVVLEIIGAAAGSPKSTPTASVGTLPASISSSPTPSPTPTASPPPAPLTSTA